MPVHQHASYRTTPCHHSFLKATKKPISLKNPGVDLPQNGGQAVFPTNAGGEAHADPGLLTYYEGDFQTGKLQWARASGLNTCVGIVVAEQVGGKDQMGYFLAFHIGGGERAWGPGLTSAESTIATWGSRRAGRVFLAALAGPQHPGTFAAFRGEIGQLAAAAKAGVTALFWPVALTTEGPEKPSMAPEGHGRLDLFKNGFVQGMFV